MQLSRRKLLVGAAPVAALAVAGCSTQLATIQQDWSTFIDQVNAILAAGCSTVVPAFTATATTIEAVVNILYPGVGAAVSGVVGAVQEVASAICSTVPVEPPAALAKKLAGSSRKLPVVIGTTVINGVPVTVTGYH